ncbi:MULTISPECIES: DUF4148 domain-containing protein [unclassified Cupriavidus]|uniref:DUF4148 domain-containing protein n=1 Tax=Cupriavidus sp. H19C3 TaxID=3241603 RepID=UPI003BF92673
MTRLQYTSFAATAVVSGLVWALSAAFPAAAQAADVPHALTRADVRADLEAWQRAGLADDFRRNAGPDFNSPDFQKRLDAYRATRMGAR